MRERVNSFNEHGISMPDDARERIILNTPTSEQVQK